MKETVKETLIYAALGGLAGVAGMLLLISFIRSVGFTIEAITDYVK